MLHSCSKAVILLALTATVSQAAPKKQVFAVGTYRLELNTVKDETILSSGGKILHRASLTQGFLSLEKLTGFQESYVATIWQKGAHGQSVFVHDLKTGKEVWRIHSSWPVKVETAPGSLSVEYTLDADKNGQFIRHRVDWHR